MNPIPAPLNGTKTHPLTPAALDMLAYIARQPIPLQEINPGVRNRFDRELLVDYVELPSPYKTHKGRKITFAQINDAGRAALSASGHS
jgi:hypothetical protein